MVKEVQWGRGILCGFVQGSDWAKGSLLQTEDDLSGAEYAEPSSNPDAEESNQQDAADSSWRDSDAEQANSQGEASERTDGGGEASTSEGEDSKGVDEDQEKEESAGLGAEANSDWNALLLKERAQYDESLKREVKAREASGKWDMGFLPRFGHSL